MLCTRRWTSSIRVALCIKRPLSSAGEACARASASSDLCIRIMNDWKALPSQLKRGGQLESALDTFAGDCRAALRGALTPRALDVDDVLALARLVSKVRTLRLRTRVYDSQHGHGRNSSNAMAAPPSDRWRDLHANLIAAATAAAPLQRDWRCLLRLLIELCALTVPAPPPQVATIEATLHALLIAHLRGEARLPAAHATALLASLNWREDLRASSALAAGVLAASGPSALLSLPPSLNVASASAVRPRDERTADAPHPHALAFALLTACGAAQVRCEPLFSQLIDAARLAIQARVWTPREITLALTRVVTLSQPAAALANTAVVVAGVPIAANAERRVVSSSSSTDDRLVLELLSATAAALTPTMLSLQYARHNVGREPEGRHLVEKEDLDEDDDGDRDIPSSGSSWSLREVVALLSVYAYAGDPVAHRRFLELLVSTAVALAEATPRLLPDETPACSQLAHSLRVLDPTPVSACLRALVPAPLARLCAAAFSRSVPPPEPSVAQAGAYAFLSAATPASAGAWVQEWVVPELGIHVDAALPGRRIIVQLDGPSHFVFDRNEGAGGDAARARMLEALVAATTTPSGQRPDAWGIASRVLTAGGYEPRYGARDVRLDAIMSHLGYKVFRVPSHALDSHGMPFSQGQATVLRNELAKLLQSP